MIYYIDGAFMSKTEAAVPANDLAVQRGYGVFDYMRTYERKVFGLEAHVERLMRSAELIEMALPWSGEEISQTILETVARNGDTGGELAVKVIATGGGGGNGFDKPAQPRLLVFVDPMFDYPEAYYTEGIITATFDDARYIPEAKTINYIPAIIAFKKARARGAHEALFANKDGRILEATRANLFVFFGDTLATAHEGILPGITRAVVMKLAGERFNLEVRDIMLDELRAADEAFISSTTKEIMPVVRVDDIVIGDGKPGEHTREMMQAFKEYVKTHEE